MTVLSCEKWTSGKLSCCLECIWSHFS
jgi:hypothetical protein